MLQPEPCEWRNTRPAWWLLYAIAALLVAVIGLVERFVDGGGLRKSWKRSRSWPDSGSIRFWLRRNRIALELEQGRQPDMMLTYLTVLVPYLTALGRVALAARPWVRRISLP